MHASMTLSRSEERRVGKGWGFHVTAVQTCALPILRETPAPAPHAEACGESRLEVDVRSLLVAQAQEFLGSPELPALCLQPSALFFTHRHTPSTSRCTLR